MNPLTASTSTLAAPVVPVTRRSVPFTRVPWRVAISSFVLGLAIVAPMSIAAALLLPRSAVEFGAIQQRFAESMTNPMRILLGPVLLIPLIEETIFRGWLLSFLGRFLPVWASATISTVAFGSLHLFRGPFSALIGCLGGTVLCWLRLQTRSIWPGVICHAAINSAVLTLGPVLGVNDWIMRADAANHSFAMAFPVWWIVASIVLCIAAVAIIRRAMSPAEVATLQAA